MNIKRYLIAGVPVLSLMLASCTDSDYDLNHIDTTAKFQANNLTVPINLEYLTLDQVMDLKDDSEIKKVEENGKTIYAVKKDGTFESDPVDVKTFVINKPSITPTKSTLNLTPVPVSVSGLIGYYIILDDPAVIDTKANNIDEAIKSIDDVDVTTQIRTTLQVSTSGGSSLDWNNVKIEELKIKFPKGFVGTSYVDGVKKGKFITSNSSQPDYSLLDLSDEVLSLNGGKVNITVDINAIDAAQTYVDPDKRNIQYTYNTHSLTLKDQIEVSAGKVNIYSSSASPVTPPSSVTFKLTPEMDAINVHTFTGKIEYSVKDFTIKPIDLSSLPDFLNQNGTKVELEKPQIYLSLNNPLGGYTKAGDGTGYVTMQTGFALTPERDGKKATPAKLDKDYFVIDGKTKASQYYVMAPSKPEINYAGFPNPEFIQFSGLKTILSQTDGIPTKIYVDAENPKMPEQDIYKFRLGENHGAVKGNYEFYAPLQFSNSTVISYTDTIDGWNDKDVDALTISKIKLNMLVSTEVPFKLDLEVVPITFDAKPISGVTCDKVTVDAMANDFPIDLNITGTIKHLDGLLIKAKVHDSDNQAVLGPQMKLYLKNSKATLTGDYTKEL